MKKGVGDNDALWRKLGIKTHKKVSFSFSSFLADDEKRQQDDICVVPSATRILWER